MVRTCTFVKNGETGRILQKVTHWSLHDLGEKKKPSKKRHQAYLKKL